MKTDHVLADCIDTKPTTHKHSIAKRQGSRPRPESKSQNLRQRSDRSDRLKVAPTFASSTYLFYMDSSHLFTCSWGYCSIAPWRAHMSAFYTTGSDGIAAATAAISTTAKGACRSRSAPDKNKERAAANDYILEPNAGGKYLQRLKRSNRPRNG